jgi:hypothetical protein
MTGSSLHMQWPPTYQSQNIFNVPKRVNEFEMVLQGRREFVVEFVCASV